MNNSSSDIEPIRIDERLVCRLVATQFPQWSDLPVRAVIASGWDNRSFHVGEHLLVRLPSHHAYEAQVDKEQRWLPHLAPLLPLAIPQPVAVGQPSAEYPLKWSIYRWIDGDSATPERIDNEADFARDLAHFLVALQGLDASQGPAPGRHNFFRGGALATYDEEAREAIARLAHDIDVRAVSQIWDTALGSRWPHAPVWIHGDVSLGNLLLRNGRLNAVIDFGNMGVGDPACDLAIAWTLFDGERRDIFRAALGLDDDTWARGRGWALWKALILAAGMTNCNAIEAQQPLLIINKVIADHPH